MNVSFVYFDVGGVLIKDFSCSDKWVKLARKLGITDDSISGFTDYWDSLERAICTDRDLQSLIPQINSRFQLNVSVDYPLLDCFINDFEMNASIWPVVGEIQKHCKVGLLTNMYVGMYRRINDAKLLPAIHWDAIVDSSLEGHIKPDVELFEIAQAKSGVSKGDVLFVENTKVHVSAARRFGWQVFRYDSCDYQSSSENLQTTVGKLIG